MKDNFGRSIEYLRISITDRCNLACSYCNPNRDFKWIPHSKVLTLEEIVQVSRAFARIGVKKIRITGGEPLLRKGVVGLVKELYGIPGIREVCLTTNGVLLGGYAKRLFDAGLRHVNVSLDTLRPERFREVTGKDVFQKVLSGIETVVDMGFYPVKVNTVLMRGINDDEIEAFSRMTMKMPIEWRCIEYMPVGSDNPWDEGLLITSKEAKARVEAAFGPLEDVRPPHKWHGPARLFRIKGAKGIIGFISPLSNHFCNECNRVRLTPEGRLRLCLFSDHEWDLMPILRSGSGVDELTRFILDAVKEKPIGPRAQRDALSCSRAMRAIGG